ncbi:MAG: PorT family protein [Lewinellaceae bacterium]|nr:PorT family protein [Lewinellaceae bacterium]
MKRNGMTFLVLIFVLGLAPILSAQPRFGAGIVAGINASQIQGDDSAGYNRLGVRAGFRGIVHLSEKSDFGLDLLYSMRGSTTELVPNNNSLRYVIHLDYIEVPVWISYKDWLSPDGYYRLQGFAGLSYGRLFNTRVVDVIILEDEQDNFAKNDLSITLGAAYHLSRRFSLGVNYTRSVVPLYDNRKFLNNVGLPRYKQRLWGYFLSFQGVLEF